MKSEVLVGGHDPDEIYKNAADRVKQAKAGQGGGDAGKEDASAGRVVEAVVHDCGEFFSFGPIDYRGRTLTVDISKDHLDEGRKHPFRYWGSYTQEVFNDGNQSNRFHPASAPFHYCILSHLSPIGAGVEIIGQGNLHTLLQGSILEGIITNTMTAFNSPLLDDPKAQRCDWIVHNYRAGPSMEHYIVNTLAGPDGPLTGLADGAAISLNILGSMPEDAERVSQCLFDGPVRIWRPRPRAKSSSKGGVVFIKGRKGLYVSLDNRRHHRCLGFRAKDTDTGKWVAP